jgi:hypothetical protein
MVFRSNGFSRLAFNKERLKPQLQAHDPIIINQNSANSKHPKAARTVVGQA